ncbi:KCNJN [Lepeophtheirus salmonis]|uniref:KCNJN n=1 Tax=Lepeophtheirus salmonis TaxID=72036 RepID=A0A7R8CTF4_LEPSM|nr:KCNJN [Lepeophtheirus salmonis]CAF2925444.1 KCNJN [Lepeophtheirus salmonis]
MILQRKQIDIQANLLLISGRRIINRKMMEPSEMSLDDIHKKSPKLMHSLSSLDSSMLKKQESSTEKELSEGFITKFDSSGKVQSVPVTYENDSNMSPLDDGKINNISDFVSTDIITKPFHFVSGNVNPTRFNPLRKKSGILNVLAEQATRNRIVAKNGYYNTIFSSKGKKWRLLKDFFTSSLDLKTQHTIGYGGRATTEQCPFAIIVLSFQSIIGVIIQACTAGIIFAKFTVPSQRQGTIIFSKNAVITIRNGALYLLWRIADLRRSTLIEASVRAFIIQKEVTEEGEVIPYHQQDLLCGSDIEGTNNRVFIIFPVTISHKIDASSPLYNYSPSELLSSRFEIICILEGTTEETGSSIQVRTSYLPNEILWGHRFEHSSIAYDKTVGSYRVNHSVINQSTVDQTPRFSAKLLDKKRQKKRLN